MTMLDKIAAEIEAAVAEEDGDNSVGAAKSFSWHRVARAALTAMMEPERIPVRRATSFTFADIEWPKAIQAILNEGAEK